MNDTRSKFEEIWPVPSGLKWDKDAGAYRVRMYYGAWSSICDSYNARLDTFTRCQETTDVYVSIVDELVKNMGLICDGDPDWFSLGVARESIDRAKQKLEQIK